MGRRSRTLEGGVVTVMTKIEELRAAFNASTRGDWCTDGGIVHACRDEIDDTVFVADCANDPGSGAEECEIRNADFIARAHSLMPRLLELAQTVDRYLKAQANDELLDDAWIVRESMAKILKGLK